MSSVVPIKSTTQAFTEIADIANDLVLFNDGAVAMVISVSAVNFGLLSETEQEALIYAYAQLLNSLSFPIELIIRSQHKDVTAYVKTLEDKEKEQKNPKLAASIKQYRAFIESTVKEKEVLDKKFYIAIPFSYLELGVTANTFIPTKKTGLPYPKSYIFERAAIVLNPKRDHLVRLLSRIGLHANQLKTTQLTHVFFTIYNPGASVPATL